MNILVTGGAGYIGSVLTEKLLDYGHSVIVVDNLSRGHLQAIPGKAIFINTDLNDPIPLNNIFDNYNINTVIHMAACISVSQSMIEPGMYFKNNTGCGINLLECMVKHNVKRFIFSSSAAIYGEPLEIPVTENCPANPVNAYGESKLMFERILHWYSLIYELEYITFRYFNVAGASLNYGSDHAPETNLIPSVLKVALEEIEYLPVFGDNYDTADGTCIRDYIHVSDIAEAHVLALDCFNKGIKNKTFNLGNGKGYSVKEVIETARRITGEIIPVRVFPWRIGDPTKLVASYKQAKKYIGWEPKHSKLEDIIESAWAWQLKHPDGYKDRVKTEIKG